MALFIFLPMILLALIIIIILLIRQNKVAAKEKSTSGQENDREMKNQDNNDQTTTESGVYTELNANRMPAYNTYMSLVHHENPCSYVIPSTSYYHETPENK